ncbi:AAA family ATPase [Kribbella sp. ALI-6-A]|uniref:AAA family ATPase n=1 Tax=Kribbella sp. ALI-6-A TaxID=1933817 RepID=UPI00097C1183|nr:AAA family ATPase [Kribbella sp. ALI-6-A]ONI67976.1 AAA family ATPase [Kribbella sp. ALI-6-A]
MAEQSAGLLARRRARGLWVRGARQLGFAKAGEEAATPDKPAALEYFTKALELDPGMTDAWLGFHAAGGDADTALDKLVAGLGRFGEERDADKRRLSSSFRAGWWFTHSLETTDHVWHAEALRRLNAGDTAGAAEATGKVIEDLRRRFLEAAVAMHRLEFDTAIDILRRIPADGHLGVEALLRLGMLLATVEQWSEAETILRQAAGQQLNSFVALDAEYYLGFVYRGTNREQNAIRQFEWVYERDNSHRQVSAALADSSVKLSTRRTERRTASPSPVVRRGAPSAPALHRQPDWAAVQGILNELDRNVGMEDVKRQVSAVAAQVRAGLMRAERGLPTAKLGGHLIFAGPPGTGKTTVARVVARLYCALGLLAADTVIETDRSGLVAEWIGQTAVKTNEVVDSALDGVLFIDEAYALSKKGTATNDFGTEAIDTLLKRMEDDRDRLVVIVAGYSEPMAEFLEANPGLRSRFSTRIDFPRYTADQLREIAMRLVESRGDHITPDAAAGLTAVLDQVCSTGRIDELGNARFIRTVLEAAGKHRDLRLFHSPGLPTDLELITLDGSDLKSAIREILSF